MAATYPHALRLFSRNVRLYLITAALIGFTFIGGVYPVLFNLFLLRLHYASESIGLFNAAGLLASALGCLPAGALGRRWGSRRAMIAGLSLAAVAYLLLPQAELVPASVRTGWLLITDALGALGIIVYVVNGIPFLTSATGREERNHVFAVQAALWPLAGFAGSLAAGLLPGFFARSLHVSLRDATPYRYPLLIAAVLLIPAVLALLATREGDVARAADRRTAAGRAPVGVIALLAVVLLLQVGGEGAARTFFNVYLDVHLHVATALIGTLMAAGQLLAVVAALAMPLLAARWGTGRTFVVASAGMALCLLPLALFHHWVAAGFGFMGMIALASITRPAINVYQMEAVVEGWRPAMSGATTMASGLGWAAMALGGGYVITASGYRSLFVLAASVIAAATLLFGAYVRLSRGALAPYPALDTAREAT
jgi:MFS family permease